MSGLCQLPNIAAAALMIIGLMPPALAAVKKSAPFRAQRPGPGQGPGNPSTD
jgi:hypothetical protein